MKRSQTKQQRDTIFVLKWLDIFFLQGVKKFFKWVLTKGGQKFTIMFVPHSGKRLLNFQIHYFTILLVFALLSAVLMLGIFLAPELETTQKELIRTVEAKDRAIESITQISKDLEPLNGSTEELGLSIDQFLREINAYSNGVPEPGIGPVDQVSTDYEGSDYFNKNDHDTLRVIRGRIDNATDKIKDATNFAHGLKEIMNVIPSIHPLFKRGILLSGFGPRLHPITGKVQNHDGIDIADIPGTPVRATAEGTVSLAQFAGGAGLMVEIQHSYGFSTRYLHLSVIQVERGQTIKRGQIIGRVGNTGLSVGPHLHYEVRVNGRPIDPVNYISLDGTW